LNLVSKGVNFWSKVSKSRNTRETMEKEALSADTNLYKVMSHPTRLTILNLLKKGEISFESLNKAIKVRKANLSQHLSILRSHNLVRFRKEGQRVYYSLVDTKLDSEASFERKNWPLQNLKEVGWLLALIMLILSPIAVLSNRVHTDDQSAISQFREFLPYDHLSHGHVLTAILSLVFWIALIYMLFSLTKGLLSNK